jgi:hypothetical protein
MPDNFSTTKSKVNQEPGTKEMQISINKSNIKVPVDIQDALEITELLMGADGTAAQAISMDKRGYAMVNIRCFASAAAVHTYVVDYSFDNVTWINYYTSGAPETLYNPAAFWHSARYWRITTAGVGGAHTVDLILASVLG